MAHANHYLSNYLNNHLAGSVSAIELLANLANEYTGTDVERLAEELRAEVSADRQELENLMDRLDVSKSVLRRAAAWVSEKGSQVKLRSDDPATGPFRLLESAETITIGVEGKRLLWLALSSAAEEDPALRGPDYQRLEQRALDQRRRLEIVRQTAAKQALKAAR